jgi:hypothetical protein
MGIRSVGLIVKSCSHRHFKIIHFIYWAASHQICVKFTYPNTKMNVLSTLIRNIYLLNTVKSLLKLRKKSDDTAEFHTHSLAHTLIFIHTCFHFAILVILLIMTAVYEARSHTPSHNSLRYTFNITLPPLLVSPINILYEHFISSVLHVQLERMYFEN